VDRRSKITTQAVIGAISIKDGLELTLIKEYSITSESFIQFLKALRRKCPERRICLFLDNLSVHKSNLVRPYYEELRITPIYNLPYSPQYNGIDRYWALLKNEYKKLLL
jgi:transposase